MGLMNAINDFMHKGSACPKAGSLGECCGIWLWFFIWQLKGRSLVAIHDPSLPEHA